MKAERWNRVHLLVEQALERTGDARCAFLDSVCGNDLELREELLSLIAACERSPDAQGLPTGWLEAVAQPERSKFAPGETIAGRYRVGRLLGRGGMGEVYEAWDEELSVPVALKTLHLPGGTEEMHRRLKLEGLLARSVWHPNVCRLYDLGHHGAEADGSTWFLTMELLRGETLSVRLREEGKFRPARAQRLAEQVARGLGAAHQAGVVHRDFKTSNIMLVDGDDGEQAMVMDFGIARAATWRARHLDAGEPELLAGTPAYMAPEQVQGHAVGPPADIYALGIVLYEMVTGTVPFRGDSPAEVAHRRLVEDAPSPRGIAPDVDERWERVILRCLAREPHRRFRLAEEIAEALAGRAPIEVCDSPRSGTRAPCVLPAERNLFVGRDVEHEQLARDLARGRRVATLVGPGGMGKTRLAIHYAWRGLAEHPGGTWFCDLTEARTVDGIASAVAGALNLQLGRGDSVPLLGRAIAGRGRCLIVLDNFEQVVDLAPAIVGRWLAAAPEARFLVTSREKLHLGEQELVLAVGPLSVETGMDLFAARARALRPGLEFAGAEVESVREIVRLVDGMPLAIELAAARMRVMGADQIAAGMRRRFSLLTGGDNIRHETLVLAIDGSWDLLKAWERSAWTQCSVFEGGFTLEAAEGVCDLTPWPEAPWVVDVLQSLVDKSLLRTWMPAARVADEIPEARFGMFVSLQEYARLKLRDDSSAGATQLERSVEQRHGEWYARYGAPGAIRKLRKRGGPRERRRIECDVDNLIAACRRAISRGDPATAVGSYRAMWALLDVRGPYSLAVDLGRQALQNLQFPRADEGQMARMLGQAEWYSGMVEDAGAHLRTALTVARERSDRHLEGLTLGDLGGLQVSQGQMDEGTVHLQMALEAACEVGDRHLECSSLSSLGIVRRGQGRMAEAQAYMERALEVARLSGDPRLEGKVLNNLGLILQDEGHVDEAREHYEAALAVHREVGHRRFEGNAHDNLGTLDLEQGRLNEARAHFQEALEIHRETGSRFSEGISLINLASLSHAQEQMAEAQLQYEEAMAIQREIGNRRLEGYALSGLGWLYQDRGEMDLARAHYDSALAIHRAEGDRRSEGSTLAHLASLFHSVGSLEVASEAVASAEPILREVNAPLNLGQLLCIRAQLEHGRGDAASARATFGEAEALAASMGSGPDSELGRMLAKLRRLLFPE